MQSGNGSKLRYFLTGFGIGATVALLFAPKSGHQLRSDIADTTRQGIGYADKSVQQLGLQVKGLYRGGRNKATELAQSGKSRIDEEKERISSAIEAGKQAYQEKKHSENVPVV
ncbi:MAG: YtxH domain-containing protein, partial [Acidobacteriota bacterium]